MQETQTMPSAENDPILLICTVGGSPDPICDAINRIKPHMVIFVCSEKSKPDLSPGRPRFTVPARTESSAAAASAAEANIDSACSENVVVGDEQKIESCIQSIREFAQGTVREWLGRSQNHRVVVDITGGTKAMSAALALCARAWPCRVYYTGGSKRERDGLGIVATGHEEAFETENPWDALGYQAIEEFRLFFNCGQFNTAGKIATDSKKRSAADKMKRQFNALETLAHAYEKWELFDHNAARTRLADATDKYANDIRACGAAFEDQKLRQGLQSNLAQLGTLAAAAGDGIEFPGELLANAQRRGAEGRLDDAVARLYRCAEAIAQYQLKTKYRIDSSKADLQHLPEELREKFKAKADAGGNVRLGLQDDYEILCSMKDLLGMKFKELKMDQDASPLSARNKSILAHGFQPISQKDYESLLRAVKQLVDIIAPGLSPVEFPRIGS